MFIHYRTQGIVLKKRDFLEADSIFIVFTKDFGKLEILGKAIRKIGSKLRGGMQEFSLSEIEFIQGKSHKTLTDAELINDFENIRKDLKVLRIGYKIAEIIDSLVETQEKDERVWEILKETFEKLNQSKASIKDYFFSYYYFLWNLLSLLGYEPEVYHCVICQKRLRPEKLYFSSQDGGIICRDCGKRIKTGDCFEIDLATIKILRIILKKDWKVLGRIKISQDCQNFLRETSNQYLSSISEKSKD